MLPRLATADDADEVGSIMAAGFLDDPVMCWVFGEPDRAVKLATLFGFLAREAQVPLGATYVSDGACAAWTPPEPAEWPEERTTNHRRIVVTGRTQPGAIVVLGDERVEVQPDGRFTHVIALREGRQRLSARVRTVGGSTSADGPVILLDTRAPDPRFDTGDLWAKPRR